MKKCNIAYPHDFPDSPCKKCNQLIMQGKPLKDNVRIEIVKSSFTAMEMADERENKTEKAKVLEIGDDVTLVKEGDIVLFKDFNCDTIKVDDEEFTIIPEEDIKYVLTRS